jgi:hypothetical protein
MEENRNAASLTWHWPPQQRSGRAPDVAGAQADGLAFGHSSSCDSAQPGASGTVTMHVEQ